MTLKLSNVWLQRIYLTVVAILAIVTLRKSQQQHHSDNRNFVTSVAGLSTAFWLLYPSTKYKQFSSMWNREIL